MPTNKNFDFVKTSKNIIKCFDLYGQNVNLYISKKTKLYSTFSGLISIGVVLIILYAFSVFINTWLNGGKMTVIPSAISYSIHDLLAKNETISYDFDYHNYYVYFLILANLPNGTQLITNDLLSFVSYNFTYFSIDGNYLPLQPEACQMQYQDVFLGLDQETIKNDVNNTRLNLICIKDSFKLGLYPDIPNNQVLQPEMFFSVYPCVNSTENNNSCSSNEDIDEMLKYVQIQTSIPSTIYNFQNSGQPQSNYYEYQNYQLDKSMYKYYQNGLIPTLLYTDYGIINDDYRLMQTNFNPKIFYDPKIRKDSDPLFVFDFIVNQNFQMYYQRNQKINEVVGSLGGLINAIVLIGKLICFTYNSIYLRVKIIRFTFSNSFQMQSNIEISPQIKRNSILNPMKLNIDFLKGCFPTKQALAFYKKGSANLYEYLDIRNIIKRLQDIDKFKMVFLNENQRRLFELIPKPEVVEMTSKFSLNSVRRSRNASKILPNLFVHDDDPINKRIMEYIDSNPQNRQGKKSKIDGIFLFFKQNIDFSINF